MSQSSDPIVITAAEIEAEHREALATLTPAVLEIGRAHV